MTPLCCRYHITTKLEEATYTTPGGYLINMWSLLGNGDITKSLPLKVMACTEPGCTYVELHLPK